jgi:uncharacterized membrane protein YkvA (DUF1232 family)
MLGKAKSWARSIKADVIALYIAAKDSRTPLSAKLISVAVVAYALSPIDLIPDFIPIIGYIDDLIIVPLGIILAIRLIPAPLMSEFRSLASDHERLPKSPTGAIAVICIWLVGAAAIGWWAYHRLG